MPNELANETSPYLLQHADNLVDWVPWNDSSLQRAQEIVTELYLSEGKKRQKYWKSLEGHLLKLKVKQQTIDHLVSQDDPQLVAKLVEKLGKD